MSSLFECWHHRELLYFLAWRDVKIRYKQTLLGAAWAVLQPLASMVVFTVVFNRVAEVEGLSGVPYPLFSLASLLPWFLFQSVLTQSSNSVAAQARLLTKVYFPRLLVPFSTVASALVDFAIASVILAGVTVWYAQDASNTGIQPGWGLLLLPAFALLAAAAAMSVGIWFAALNAKYRDFRYVVPFLVRMGMFISPVAYTAAEFSRKLKLSTTWQWLYGLNPMTGVIEGFRWALFGKADLDVQSVLISVVVVVVLFVGGLVYFRRMEREFADLL